MHTNFKITHNRRRIILKFLCALFFLQPLRIQGNAVAWSDNSVHNSQEGYRMLAGEQNHPKPLKPHLESKFLKCQRNT